MMNKLIAMMLAFFPILAAADTSSSLSFTPPASDYSVVFLGNIFGVVDGILHGTGSQIMGAMFSVFNAAVLALGGIVIMYTLLVSTMNTAHEGQMLGQKWSSIWIPVRATLGLALLIPKASGYCLMQIFVMWIIVQGVGAADKIWDAALSYLNRGGAIIQAQMDPTTALLAAGSAGIPTGAQVILAGEVCMLGLQNQLQTQLQNYQNQAQGQTKSGPCSGAPSEVMSGFCTSTVPNFINSVNVVDIQTANPQMTTFTAQMPNFEEGSPYNFLNGICGTITWNQFPPSSVTAIQTFLSPNELQTASMSRVIAIQQMYMDLAAVAQIMVGNDPLIGPQTQQNQNQNSNNQSNLPAFAAQQLGVPQTAAGVACTDNTTPNCILWGGDPTFSASAPLLNGTEFPGALEDYNAIMLPTLTLVAQAANTAATQNSRAFIQNASTEGWIMAGSYFFNLVNLNVQASAGGAGNLVDTNTGLNNSNIDPAAIVSAFTTVSGGNCVPGNQYIKLCQWFNNDIQLVNPIKQLIDGTGSITPIPMPKLSGTMIRDEITGIGSLTVFGYTNNSTILQLPSQPGIQVLGFAQKPNINVNYQQFYLPAVSFSCGSIDLGLVSPCVGRDFGNLFYNDIFRWMYNTFLSFFGKFIEQAIMAFLQLPLEGMQAIFAAGLKIIDTPGVNPVVALANMGTYYINFAANLWLTLVEMSIVASLIPIFGIFIFALISMTMPILMAWLGIMLQIGFTTAYYVPILPYMIFTFGSIAWLMAVIEAMVAAPIVALGVTHPEGHDAFGKGEQAIMILMNVFLRPAMMIIGYIAAIALTYVSVWIINAGFDNAIVFIEGANLFGIGNNGSLTVSSVSTSIGNNGAVNAPGVTTTITGGYTGWAGIFAYFFSILVYTMLYLTVVQKAFTLISALPDKVLRWIGGQQESYGADTAQWGQEVQGKVSEAGKDTATGQAQMDKQLTAHATDLMGKGQKKGGGGGAGVDATPG